MRQTGTEERIPEFFDAPPAALTDLPAGSVICIVGAGGKTSLLKLLAEHYRRRGFRVLAGTTTHMERPASFCTTAESAVAAMDEQGYALAGLPDPHNGGKIIPLAEEELLKAVQAADITVLEADGARHMSVKVPYDHEPVIPPYATHVVVVGGLAAVGKRIEEAAYNPEGVVRFLSARWPEAEESGTDLIITGEMLEYLVRYAYAGKVRDAAPQAGLTAVFRQTAAAGKKEPQMTHYHMIYLAAGFGRRFGSNKLLCMIDGRPMYRHVLDRLADLVRKQPLPCDLTVVTQYETIRESLKDTPCDVVINPDPARGISSSIAEGIRHLAEKQALMPSDMLIFFNADQPGLREETILSFLRMLDEKRPQLAAMGIHGEARNPCAFHAAYAEELMSLRGDTGGRQILKKHADQVFVFNADSPEELEDIDML